MGEPPAPRRPPRRVPRRQRFPHPHRHPLPAHPRRIPRYEVESALRQHIAEVRLEGEERCAALALEPPRRGSQLSPAAAQPTQQRPLVGREPPPPTEQVAVLRRRDQLGCAPLQRRHRRPEQVPGERRLGAGEAGERVPLRRPGQAEQRAPGAAQSLELGRGSRGGGPAAERPGEREWVDQRVSLAHVPVQVRQRRDAGELPVVGLGAHVRDQREPQPQLGEPHRGEAQVHAEQRVRHHVAPHRARRPLARSATQPRQLVERAQQKRSRPHRRVEHGQAPQVGRSLRRLAAMDPALGGGRGEAEAVDQRGLEPGAYDLPHQRGGRVVAAAGAPLGGIHHALEHAAQHVGGDHVAVFGLARRKMESLQQVVERVAPLGVAPPRGAVAPLQGGGLEQAAVQERQPAERPSRARAVGGGAIKGPEAQRVEDPAVKRPPGGDAVVESADQVAAVPVQPPFSLDEVEEQHPCERGQRERVPLRPAARGRQPISEALERGAERAKEAWCDGFARERLTHPQAERQRRLAWSRG